MTRVAATDVSDTTLPTEKIRPPLTMTFDELAERDDRQIKTDWRPTLVRLSAVRNLGEPIEKTTIATMNMTGKANDCLFRVIHASACTLNAAAPSPSSAVMLIGQTLSKKLFEDAVLVIFVALELGDEPAFAHDEHAMREPHQFR